MRTEDLFEVILAGEGQTVEFKESLTSSAKREAIQTMVAFANAQGGRVFFGVGNDGRAKGVQLGGDTQERLAKLVRDHTYPSVPFVIDDPFMYEGKTVLSVEVSRDVPPVIGVYIYSAIAIPPDKPVDTSQMQAYRRVGRTNQKEDFMRLREALPSDPRVRVVLLSGHFSAQNSYWRMSVRVWVEDGSASAHDIQVCFDPDICEASDVCSDLPQPYMSSVEVPGSRFGSYDTRYGFRAFQMFERVSRMSAGDMPPQLRVIARYKDDWGLTWEAVRSVERTIVESQDKDYPTLVDRGDFKRTIVSFPPKAG